MFLLSIFASTPLPVVDTLQAALTQLTVAEVVPISRKIIVFDTETTGISRRDRIVEIAFVELDQNFASTGKSLHRYFNPDGCPINPEAFKVHGLTLEFLENKPKFGDCVDEILAFISGATLVAHNASFDMRLLNAELGRLKKDPIPMSNVVDTLKMARSKFPKEKNTLDALCERFQISLESRTNSHGALIDVNLLIEVYRKLIALEDAIQ